MSTNNPVRPSIARPEWRRVTPAVKRIDLDSPRTCSTHRAAVTDFNQGRTRTWDWHGSKAR